MVETVTRKRIEILADTALLPRLIDLVNQVDISGYSVVRVAAGGSRAGGKWRSDDLTGASSKSMLIALAPEDKAQAFTDLIEPMLSSHGLLLTIGEVEVVRGERF